MSRKYTEAVAKAVAKYQKENYSHISVLIRKEKKQMLQDYCTRKGKTLNGLINEMIDAELGKEEQ